MKGHQVLTPSNGKEHLSKEQNTSNPFINYFFKTTKEKKYNRYQFFQEQLWILENNGANNFKVLKEMRFNLKFYAHSSKSLKQKPF